MKNTKRIEENVETALNSIEGLKPAKANPFLYTRIQQRLKNSQQVSAYGSWLYKLALAIIIFIGINVYSFSKFSNRNAVEAKPGTGINAFANEYGLQQPADNI